MNGIPFGSALSYEGAFGSEKASGSESAHSTGSNETTSSILGSLGATLPNVFARHALSDEAQSSESAPSLQPEIPAAVSDEPNRW